MKSSLYRLLLVDSRLDAAIREEHQRRRPNDLRLLRLKALSLAIRERLHRLFAAPRQGIA